MKVLENISLKPYNTFGINALANSLISVKSEAELRNVLREYPQQHKMILGGGSNILFTQKRITNLLIKNDIQGISVVKEWKNHVWVAAGGGVIWHDFVLWCIKNDYGGVENLSLIPGTVGAAPIQNIGAYGVELKDIFLKLSAIHLLTKKQKTFYANDCKFGYRESIFKHAEKGKYCITKVYFKLTKIPHRTHIEYGAIRQYLGNNIAPSITDVSNAVIAIRQSKLPDPRKIGNAGSFFKNPEISQKKYALLRKQFIEMPSYPTSATTVKIPAGWLIEQCGWKGIRHGDVGCHAQQALVLVNYGEASGQDILQLAHQIQDSVLKTFGIQLHTEVNII
ncbi:MAG: UDP-N-acetylmuramate dehydrogenase [Saprospiraceae bacterium]|nr:UDP-N-acetylmuramate dehydrogenase [Saprospiraceae bacterium]MBP7699789.1 UDP-N-acetylmuramate dehydrogenase [Saprospiraceae bacterium]